jgi:Zn ribbon nucleic-acid-binding protein
MAATHVEFASEIAGMTCPDCSQDTVREAMLVNPHGLVLARGTSCAHCGHQRHRERSARAAA